MAKSLPRGYDGYPAILLGRLALTDAVVGQGFGGMLMSDALEKAVLYSDQIGTRAIVVDPIDEDAASFYEKYMFNHLIDSERMILNVDNTLRNHFGLGNIIE
jgi:GNAT superfamily N-acetyltransferase